MAEVVYTYIFNDVTGIEYTILLHHKPQGILEHIILAMNNNIYLKITVLGILCTAIIISIFMERRINIEKKNKNNNIDCSVNYHRN